MNRNHITIILCFVFAFLLTNCHSRRNNQDKNGEESVIYPMDVIRDTLTSDVHSQTTLYPLQEEVLESFLEKARTDCSSLQKETTSFETLYFFLNKLNKIIYPIYFLNLRGLKSQLLVNAAFQTLIKLQKLLPKSYIFCQASLHIVVMTDSVK